MAATAVTMHSRQDQPNTTYMFNSSSTNKLNRPQHVIPHVQPMAERTNMNVYSHTTQTPVTEALQSGVPTNYTSTSINGEYTANSYEQSRRQISSVVISEEYLGFAPPEHSVRYVEVPVIENIIKKVPKKSVIEVEKIVPRYEIEYVEKIVEVPQIQYVDQHVEKNEIREIIREVKVGAKQIQEIPKNVVRTVPKIQYVNVEKIREVPGEIIQVSKDGVPLTKQPNQIIYENVPVVVAQTIRPVITNSQDVVEIDVFEYEPQIIPVDVHVAAPMASKLTAMGAVQEYHERVSIAAPQYNTILKALNQHLKDDVSSIPCIEENGSIPFLAPEETTGFVPLKDYNQLHLEQYANTSHNVDSQKNQFMERNVCPTVSYISEQPMVQVQTQPMTQEDKNSQYFTRPLSQICEQPINRAPEKYMTQSHDQPVSQTHNQNTHYVSNMTVTQNKKSVYSHVPSNHLNNSHTTSYPVVYHTQNETDEVAQTISSSAPYTYSNIYTHPNTNTNEHYYVHPQQPYYPLGTHTNTTSFQTNQIYGTDDLHTKNKTYIIKSESKASGDNACGNLASEISFKKPKDSHTSATNTHALDKKKRLCQC